jgi:MFS family permease
MNNFVVPFVIRTLADFLALKRNTAALLLMAVLVGIGEKIADRYLPLYLLLLGGGVASIGIFSGANNLVNALYSYFGGYISDRIGHKRALLLFNIMTIAGYSIVLLVHSWAAVIAGSFLFLTWSAISTPATLDLVAKSVPLHKRAMGVSINSLVRRVPMILGPLLGGVLIERFGEADGIRYSFAIAILLAFVSLLIQQLLIRSDDTHRPQNAQPNPLTLWHTMSAALKNLLVSDILIRFCEQIPNAFVVIWCVNIAGISALEFGVLTTVEMVTALLVYIPVAHFADRTTKKPFVVATFVFFTLFPLVLLFSQSFMALIAAFIVRGLKEFGEPTRKSLILDLSPEQRRAGMFGFYYLLRDSIVSVAAFAGAWLWQVSPAVNLLAACLFGVIGTIWFWLRGKE